MPPRPNLLFLMVDQMQAAVLRPGHPCLTPHLDALAARGVRYDRATTPSAVCSPSRASLFTGRLPHSHGVWHVTHCQSEDQSVLRDLPHWAQQLDAAGYATGYFGKWHVSRDRDSLARYGWQTAVFEDSPQFAAEMKTRGRLDRKSQPKSPDHALSLPAGYGPAPLYGVGDWPVEKTPGALTYELASEWLAPRLTADQPWACVVSITEPHEPFYSSRASYARYDVDSLPLSPSHHDPLTDKPALYARSARAFADLTEREHREARACYYALVSEIDTLVGRLIAQLTAAGRLDNTVIVFTTDHGELLGAHGGLYTKNVGAFEEVYNIPLIIAGPGISRRGTSAARVGLIDLGPTLLDHLGLPPLNTAGESRSFAATLRDPASDANHRTQFAEYDGTRIHFTQRVWWHDNWKFIFNPFADDELYHLATDPSELRNLIADPAHAGTADTLMREMWAYIRATNDRELLNSGAPPLRLGRVGPG
jgi:arylsulfatase A-like enzyme